MNKLLTLTFAFCLVCIAWSAAPAPTTRPAIDGANPDQMLKQLLSPSRPPKPIDSVEFPPEKDQTGRTAVAPKAELQNLVREGTIIFNRTGRLTKTPDGQQELTFESDGAAMKDPPMLILPNLKLTLMENSVKAASADLKFLVSGIVTEYGARNHILLEKVVVVQDGPIMSNRKRSDEKVR